MYLCYSCTERFLHNSDIVPCLECRLRVTNEAAALLWPSPRQKGYEYLKPQQMEPLGGACRGLPQPVKEIEPMKHVVLNDKAQVMFPAQHNYPSGDKPQQQPSFASATEAKTFATFLACKFRDQGFHVFSAVGTARTDAPPVKWTKAAK